MTTDFWLEQLDTLTMDEVYTVHGEGFCNLAMFLSGLASLIQLDPVSRTDRVCRTVIYRHSSLLYTVHCSYQELFSRNNLNVLLIHRQAQLCLAASPDLCSCPGTSPISLLCHLASQDQELSLLFKIIFKVFIKTRDFLKSSSFACPLFAYFHFL